MLKYFLKGHNYISEINEVIRVLIKKNQKVLGFIISKRCAKLSRKPLSRF